MFDQTLISKINSRRCFVLIGSGPSCEMGYPSWKKLAELTYEEVTNKGDISEQDKISYEKYLQEGKYPEFFKHVERKVGDRLALIELIKPLLEPSIKKRSTLYQLLCKWPFACYLTTNYDDEIKNHLSELGQYFAVIQNSQEDFYLMRDGASNMIQKLHSDLSHPDKIVLTSTDYQNLYMGTLKTYFREELMRIFRTFNVFIIGHSLSDPDIQHILKLSNEFANPLYPIYMIAENVTEANEREYFEQYNITLIGYKNHDGMHLELRQMLQTIDRFIVPRTKSKDRLISVIVSEEEIETTAALFLYRKLHNEQSVDILSPIILRSLSSSKKEDISRNDIITLPTLKAFSRTDDAFQEAINDSLIFLQKEELISGTDKNISLTDRGKKRIQEYQIIRKTQKDQAFGQFSLMLRKIFNEISDQQLQKCQKLAEETIVKTFASRGLTIANMVFLHQSVERGDISDIFGYISSRASELDGINSQNAFMEAMYQFLVEPNAPQKEYLASVSQGYFMYHLLGLDPKCSALRQDIFDKTLWIFDSSVLLPLLAIGSYNHDYAAELFETLVDAGATLYTTPNLLSEAWRHLQWALEFIKENEIQSLEFLYATQAKGGYTQNLFLDGYIRLCADGSISTFDDYLKLILPSGNNIFSFEEKISQIGFHVNRISDIDGFVPEDWAEVEETKLLVQEQRMSRGTYRSEFQIETEAEIYIILEHFRSGKYSLSNHDTKMENFYFVSQSKILNHVSQSDVILTWTPEAVYRYVTTVSGKQIDAELLQQCMLHEYYYAGVSFIDKDRYLRFFGPSINSAKLSFEEEKEKYINEIESGHAEEINEAFHKTSDLEKPFFIAQMGWKLAEKSRQKEEAATERAREAEAKVKQLEAEKNKAWKTQEKRRQKQEAGRLRNLKDLKHLRKRLRQRKKRNKKKK